MNVLQGDNLHLDLIDAKGEVVTTSKPDPPARCNCIFRTRPVVSIPAIQRVWERH